jgi:hypothetical protein
LATGNRGEITFRVNRAAARDITADEAAGAKVEPAKGDVAIQELGPEGVSLVTPAALAASLLPILKASFQKNPDAANYLETTVTDPDDCNRYVLVSARSAQQTPHELRMTAEKRLATARQDAHRAKADFVYKLLGTGSRGPSRHLPGRREGSPGRPATRAQTRQRGLGLAPPALRIDHWFRSGGTGSTSSSGGGGVLLSCSTSVGRRAARGVIPVPVKQNAAKAVKKA